MQKDTHLSITSDSTPNGVLVEINGQVVPIRSINVDFAIDHVALACIELEVPHTEIDGVVRTYLHPATHKLLKAAGWTPPEEANRNDRMLSILLLLAVGGTITVSDRLEKETSFHRVGIVAQRMQDNTTVYRILEVQTDENPRN